MRSACGITCELKTFPLEFFAAAQPWPAGWNEDKVSVLLSAPAQPGGLAGFGRQAADGKVSIRDLQAKLLHQCGLNPYTLSFPFQGLNNRLIGPTEEGKIARDLLI